MVTTPIVYLVVFAVVVVVLLVARIAGARANRRRGDGASEHGD